MSLGFEVRQVVDSYFQPIMRKVSQRRYLEDEGSNQTCFVRGDDVDEIQDNEDYKEEERCRWSWLCSCVV